MRTGRTTRARLHLASVSWTVRDLQLETESKQPMLTGKGTLTRRDAVRVSARGGI